MSGFAQGYVESKKDHHHVRLDHRRSSHAGMVRVEDDEDLHADHERDQPLLQLVQPCEVAAAPSFELRLGAEDDAGEEAQHEESDQGSDPAVAVGALHALFVARASVEVVLAAAHAAERSLGSSGRLPLPSWPPCLCFFAS